MRANPISGYFYYVISVTKACEACCATGHDVSQGTLKEVMCRGTRSKILPISLKRSTLSGFPNSRPGLTARLSICPRTITIARYCILIQGEDNSEQALIHPSSSPGPRRRYSPG